MKLSSYQEKKVKQFMPKHSKGSAVWWVLQRVSGALVFLFVLFHMLVNHYLTALMDTETITELDNFRTWIENYRNEKNKDPLVYVLPDAGNFIDVKNR